MFLEIHQAAVKASDWALVITGDEAARERVRQQLDGKVLYVHNLSVEFPEYIPITLEELNRFDVISSVTIHKDEL